MHHLYNCASINQIKNHRATFHSLSLLSLSEYAPSRLRDDEPFCVVTGLEAFLESVVDAFESERQNTQRCAHRFNEEIKVDNGLYIRRFLIYAVWDTDVYLFVKWGLKLLPLDGVWGKSLLVSFAQPATQVPLYLPVSPHSSPKSPPWPSSLLQPRIPVKTWHLVFASLLLSTRQHYR